MISSVLHKNASNASLAFREYWRDNRDRIVAWKRGSGGGLNGMENGRGDRYAYDAEGQLTQASYRALNPEPWLTPSGAMRSDSFQYDALGNRFGAAQVASRGPMNFARRDNGLNQYLNWSPMPVIYDDNWFGEWVHPGNGVTMADGYITASYNALNQPVAMGSTGIGSNFYWFWHDPLGRCVKRWLGNGSQTPTGPITYFYYDGWNLVQEGPTASTADRLYVHGGRVDEVVASKIGIQWYNHHYDARGHCILLTTSGGTIQEQYDYDAFGMPYIYNAGGTSLGNSGGVGNRFLFTGREWLKDLRVYDYRHRVYQPELGRFLQPDPTQFEAGDYNLYRYCHNDPVNKSDPLGLDYQVNAVTEADAAAYRAASQYLQQSPSFRSLMSEIKAGKEMLTIQVQTVKDRSLYDPEDRTADWNPTIGGRFAEGTHSPAMVLVHELIHGRNDMKNRGDYVQKAREKYGEGHPDRRFGNAEEKRTVTGLERKIARELGESVRDNHRDTKPEKRRNALDR